MRLHSKQQVKNGGSIHLWGYWHTKCMVRTLQIALETESHVNNIPKSSTFSSLDFHNKKSWLFSRIDYNVTHFGQNMTQCYFVVKITEEQWILPGRVWSIPKCYIIDLVFLSLELVHLPLTSLDTSNWPQSHTWTPTLGGSWGERWVDGGAGSSGLGLGEGMGMGRLG